jgi:hypothetical protein
VSGRQRMVVEMPARMLLDHLIISGVEHVAKSLRDLLRLHLKG